MKENSPNFEPVAGVVIPLSTRKVLGAIGFCLVMLSGGIVIAWAWWTENELPLPAVSVRISTAGGLSGLLAAAIAGFLTPCMIFFSFAREKLIIARDRLQILHKSGSSQSVDVQIPFRNISKVFCGDDEGTKFIGILLENPADPDTYAAGWNFQTSGAADGWHYQIGDGYQRGVDEIYQMILDRLRAQKNV